MDNTKKGDRKLYGHDYADTDVVPGWPCSVQPLFPSPSQSTGSTMVGSDTPLVCHLAIERGSCTRRSETS